MSSGRTQYNIYSNTIIPCTLKQTLSYNFLIPRSAFFPIRVFCCTLISLPNTSFVAFLSARLVARSALTDALRAFLDSGDSSRGRVIVWRWGGSTQSSRRVSEGVDKMILKHTSRVTIRIIGRIVVWYLALASSFW